MTTRETGTSKRPRLLIEEWLPIAEIGIESVRERTPMTPFPAPNRLHVWWARRPLVASRAAVLASLLPADADREKFLHMLGIHGDPVASRRRIDEAKRSGERFEGQAYTYKRAFTYVPTDEERSWLREQARLAGYDDEMHVLDPTAGGGSIPFEASRLGLPTVANDLNPVAWLILKATVEFPARLGQPLLKRFEALAAEFVRRRDAVLQPFIPSEPESDCIATNWLWARTINCPYCNGLVPLSPNWKLDSKGKGVRLVPHVEDPEDRRCAFEVVEKGKDHSPGTVKGGDGLCPYPDCGRVIPSDEIKAQAQAGAMGQQLYAVVFKRTQVVGHTKTGKLKVRSSRGFRAPRPEDDMEELVQAALDAKMPEWQARNVVPDEQRYVGFSDRVAAFGVHRYVEMFSKRQLLAHCTSVEVFQGLVDELRCEGANALREIDCAALTYLALACDKAIDYNSRQCIWHANREVVAHTFARHDFFFKPHFVEMASTVAGVNYDWTIEQTGKALKELIQLTACDKAQLPIFSPPSQRSVSVFLGSGDAIPVESESIDCAVLDPPYYDNVMYAELADFFYVWLKRTAGRLYPDAFVDHLTDKDREAVANPARYRDGEQGIRALAARDYEDRMAGIFAECRRVLKANGVMTVMFTHKASGAWDALASGLVQAGFEITASWPINTEAEGSLHIKEKSAAKSTIFLVCRIRQQRDATNDPIYWEEVEPKVQEAVRRRIAEFQAAGIGGIDLYLASFGPALQVFSESWPLQRGRAVQKPNGKQGRLLDDWDPYAVRPEDALDAARREVKRWRMEQLATVKRQHHLDPLTEWYVLAWDAFRAPRFPADEALRLSRVVGLDFDRDVKNRICEVKSADVVLWDSKTRHAKGKLGPVSDAVMLDTLHQAAVVARDENTGAAKTLIEDAGLLADATLLTTLEALLNVLPPATVSGGKKADPLLTGASNDFEALEKLRRLAFAEEVPAPKEVQFMLPGFGEAQEGNAGEE